MSKYKEFGELKPGDTILGPTGEPVKVTKVYDKYMPEKMYELELDGELVRCSGNHLWYSETQEDYDNRVHYFNLARHYLKTETIPNKITPDSAYPIELIAGRFVGDSKVYGDFIRKVALSLGHTIETPEVFFDEFDYVGERLVKLYSVNNIIDFLNEMKNPVLNGEGYFYFGKVRTTDEIFDGDWGSTNIPTRKEIEAGNTYIKNDLTYIIDEEQ